MCFRMLPKLPVAGDLSLAGRPPKLFHTRVPATAKLLSPRVIRVHALNSECSV